MIDWLGKLFGATSGAGTAQSLAQGRGGQGILNVDPAMGNPLQMAGAGSAQSFAQGRGGQVPVAGAVDPAGGELGLLGKLAAGASQIGQGLANVDLGKFKQDPIKAPATPGRPKLGGGKVNFNVPNLVGLTPRARDILASGLYKRG